MLGHFHQPVIDVNLDKMVIVESLLCDEPVESAPIYKSNRKLLLLPTKFLLKLLTY